MSTNSWTGKAAAANIRKQFRKTKLCSYHLAGRCTFGAQCFYAHEQAEVHDAPDLKKTKLCIAWQDGKCSKASSACNFAHGPKELRSTQAVYKTVLCQWYQTGHCSLGNSCRYAHGDCDYRSPPTSSSREGTKKKKRKEKNKPAQTQDIQLPLGMPNFDPQQTEILQHIVALCSQIQFPSEPPSDGQLPTVPIMENKLGFMGALTPSTAADSTSSPNFASADAVATPAGGSHHASPLFIPSDGGPGEAPPELLMPMQSFFGS